MKHNMTPQQLAQLWDDYGEAAKQYEAAKKATDAAAAAREAACQACEIAYRAWETACAAEVRYGKAVRHAAVAFQTASDADFLNHCGIQPDSILAR